MPCTDSTERATSQAESSLRTEICLSSLYITLTHNFITFKSLSKSCRFSFWLDKIHENPPKNHLFFKEGVRVRSGGLMHFPATYEYYC
jgi:hypothetical protein